MKHEEYNYWLSNITNIGLVKIEMLLQYFGCAEETFRASRKSLEELQEGCMADSGRRLFSDTDIDAILSGRDEEKIQENFQKLQSSGIRFISKEDTQYPERLRQIYAPPFALYIKGSLPPKDSKCLAVIGARDCSQYGKEMAKYLAGAVAKEGIAVISGLARGIDSYSHQGALAAEGITYGVLGCGIDTCYPKENIGLYMDIQKEGGIISEYAPGVKPIAGNFPMRNRIISGLSDAILVIEARLKSGSLITVDLGLEQGKEIYALPGKATDVLSEGCNNLIKMGAKLVTSPKDILEDFIKGYQECPAQPGNSNKKLDELGEKVYARIELQPKHIEEIAILTKLPMDQLMEQLLLLELKGLVKQDIKNFYSKPIF